MFSLAAIDASKDGIGKIYWQQDQKRLLSRSVAHFNSVDTSDVYDEGIWMTAKIRLVTLRRPMKLILLSSDVDSVSRQVTDMVFKLR